MKLNLKKSIKALLPAFMFFFTCEVSAQVNNSQVSNLADPSGLHLKSTHIYAQSELNGFIRLSGLEENNDYSGSSISSGERVEYYNGTYNYDITQGGTSIQAGTFSVNLDTDLDGDLYITTPRNTVLDPSQSNYLFKEFDNAFSIDISSLTLAPGNYSLSINKTNHSSYTFSFSIINYNLTSKSFTSEDDIVLTGVSNLSNQTKNFTLEEYIEYDGIDRNICSSNCTIFNNSFTIQNDGSWTIDLTSLDLAPGEYKIIVDSQEFVFQVRSALSSKDTSQTITLDPITIQEGSPESFLFESFNNFTYSNKYTDYHRIELIKPNDWNDIAVVGEPLNNSAKVEHELHVPSNSTFIYAHGTTPNYSDPATLRFGNYNYARTVLEGKATYSPFLGQYTSKVGTVTGSGAGSREGSYYEFYTPIDYLEPHLTMGDHLFKEMTIKSIFDSFAYKAEGHLREIDEIDRDFEFRLYRYNSNGAEIYDAVKVTAKLAPQNDFASIKVSGTVDGGRTYQDFADSYNVTDPVRDFLETVTNNDNNLELLIGPDWQQDTAEKVTPLGAQVKTFKIQDLDYNSDYNLELYFENGYYPNHTKTVDADSGIVTIETLHYTITHPILFTERYGTFNYNTANDPIHTITIQFKDINKFTPGDSRVSNILFVLKEVNTGAYNAANYIQFNGSFYNPNFKYSYEVDKIVFEATPNYTSANTISGFPLSNPLFSVSDIDFVDSDYVKDDLNDGGFSELILDVQGITPGLNEKLIFDGEELSITSDQTGTLSSGYSYVVDYATDKKSSSITFDLTKDVSGVTSGSTNETTKLLLESINYKIEGDPCSLPGGERTITINKISKLLKPGTTPKYVTPATTATFTISESYPYYPPDYTTSLYTIFSLANSHTGLANISGFIDPGNYSNFNLTFLPYIDDASNSEIRSTDQYSLDENTVRLSDNLDVIRVNDATVIGQWSNSATGITISLNAATTTSDLDNIINSITYASTNLDGSQEKIKIDWEISDGSSSYSDSRVFCLLLVENDQDGDGYIDSNDAFPTDSSEWLDTDNDGIGNNADLDDDGDGTSDTKEVELGTDPLVICDFPPIITGSRQWSIHFQSEAQIDYFMSLDCDGDGYTNGEEYYGRLNYYPTNASGILSASSDTTTNNDLSFLLDICDVPGNELKSDYTPTAEWGALDCDDDGLTNAQEVAGGTSPYIADTDGDGVIDLNDQCPNSPSGATVDSNGCSLEVSWADNYKIDFNETEGNKQVTLYVEVSGENVTEQNVLRFGQLYDSRLSITDGGGSVYGNWELTIPAGDYLDNAQQFPLVITLSDDQVLNQNLIENLNLFEKDWNGTGLWVTAKKAVINITDNEEAVFTVTPISDVAYEGGSGSYKVSISARPQNSADVYLEIVSDDPTEAVIVEPSVVKFNNNNINGIDIPVLSHTIQVNAPDDSEIDGDKTSTLSFTFIAQPNTFAQPNVRYAEKSTTASFQTLDDETTRIFVDNLSFTITETVDNTAQVGASLSNEPTGQVKLYAATSSTEFTISGGPLTFDNSNWSTIQYFTITAVDDSDIDGDTISQMIVSVDSGIGNYIDANVKVKVLDDDAKLIFGDLKDVTTNTINDIYFDTANNNSPVIPGPFFTVVLPAQPTSDVIVQFSVENFKSPYNPNGSGDPLLGAINSLTFTANNWNVPQTIQLSPLSNHPQYGYSLYWPQYNGVSSTINVSTTSDSDALFAGLSHVLNVGVAPEPWIWGDVDTDGDGIPDNIEIKMTGHATDEIDGCGDLDGDGANNYCEIRTEIELYTVLQLYAYRNSTDLLCDNSIPAQANPCPPIPLFIDWDPDWGTSLNQSHRICGPQGCGDLTSEIIQRNGPVAVLLSNADNEANFEIGNLVQVNFNGILASGNILKGSIISTQGSNYKTDFYTEIDLTECQKYDISYLTQGNYPVTINIYDQNTNELLATKDLTFRVTDGGGRLNGVTRPENADCPEVTPGVTVSKNNIEVSESGTSNSFTVVLDSEITSDVVLNLSVSDLTEASISPENLTFTPTDMGIPQTITVTGVDDFDFDGDIQSTITIAIDDSNSDDTYDAIDNVVITLTTINDEIAILTKTGSTTEAAPTTIAVNENTTSVYDFDSNTDVTYALSGTDVSFFSIDTDGNLSFVTAPDYESGTISYSIGIVITDASNTSKTDLITISIINIDEIAPTVISIVTDDLDDKLKDADVVRVTTTFSEAMTASPTIDIDLPNGTDISGASMTQSTTADVWYYDWTVSDGGDGTATITVAGSDLAGNAYTGTDTDTVTIDNTAPTLTITAADTSLIIAETSVVTFTFSEYVLGFEDADITFEGGGSLSSISATSSQVFSATYTPPSATTGTVTLTVGASTFEDIVGNNNTTATISFMVDTQSPTLSSVSISSSNSDSAKAKVGDTVTLSFTSSEVIQSPTVTINGNAATISGSGTSWTATYALVSGDTEGALAFAIDFQDTAGNSGTQVTGVTDSSLVTFDKTAPTVISIVTDDSDDKVKDTDVVRVTTTFSEAMTASPTIDIDLPNGTDISGASMTQSTTADVWYYDWTVSDGGDGTATITVAGSDLAANAYAGGDTDTVTIDNTAPILTITAADTSLIIAETSVVTFTFSEDVLGFVDADITLEGGGSLSSISATSSQVFSATYTPPSATTGTVTLTVGASAFEDIVGNNNTTATISFTVDTLAPITSELNWSDVANLTLTIGFSEAIYSTNSGTGSLTASDFTAAVTGSGFSAVSISQVTQLTPNSYSIVLSATGTVNGDEFFEILPAANSIFDSLGNVMDVSQIVKTLQYNSKPVFSDTTSINVTLEEGGTVILPVGVRLNATDTDGPSAIVYNIRTLPTVGSLSISQTLTGDITYTHNGSEVKTDKTTLVANDGATDSDPIEINIIITNVNDLPSVTSITSSVTVVEDANTTIDLSSIVVDDVDVQPKDVVSLTLSVLNGSISASSTASITVTQTESTSLSLSGIASDLTDYLDTTTYISYLSALNAQGTNQDVIRYSVNDNAGSGDIGVVSTTQVNITNTNDAPQGVSQIFQGNLGSGVITSGTLSGTDTDPSETLTFTLVGNPSYGNVVINNDGSFVYTHDGTAVASDFFTFNVNDGDVNSANTATATLSFNQSPVVSAQSFTLNENESISITPSYTDNEDDPVATYSIVSQPTYGVVTVLSTGYKYDHDGTDAILQDQFTIKLNDGYTDSNVATITLNITPVNDPPTTPTVNFTVIEGGQVSFNLSSSDEEGLEVTYLSLSQPSNGSATISGSLVTYIHNGTETISDQFSYTVTDGTTTVRGTINGIITLVNDPPVVPEQKVYVHERESESFELNAFDEEGDAIISYTLKNSPLLGEISFQTAPTVRYSHTPGLLNTPIDDQNYSFVYPDSFTYQVATSQDSSNEGTVNIYIIPFDHDQDGVPSKEEDLNRNGNFNDDDTDGDGIPNFLDVDDDQDTIPTIFENFFAQIYNGDSDSDGILNYLDEDDDNDGILTKYETPFNPFFSPRKNPSKVRYKKSWDYNPKRWSMTTTSKGSNLSNKEDVVYPDTDGDGIPDFADIDDDGDGVLTKYEVPDVNSDGNPTDALDSDQESVPNYLDIDDDDDGVLTKYEIPDQNGDGIPDDALDSDQEQIPNYLDVDDDNDSVLTFFELPDQNGDGIPDDALDSDNEQIPNYLDVDDDNDSIPTINEIPDQDGDGVPDDALNSDNEDTPNYIDVDDDNDNVLTIEEDYDGDGNPLNDDRDNDGIIDAYDSKLADKDSDGVSDEYDSENENPNNDQDGDGFGNMDETICGFDPLDPNEYPSDMDADGIVNCIDDDIDGDGVPNEQDAFPENVFESSDSDGDGIGDNTDVEDDRVYPVEVSGVLTPDSGTDESVWLITNIDKHPGNSVVVYNKNGQVVYSAVNYKNNWRGNYKQSNEPLPAGTYYYIVRVSEADIRKGWLYITY